MARTIRHNPKGDDARYYRPTKRARQFEKRQARQAERLELAGWRA